MAMVVMSVFEGTEAALPPGGRIVHDQCQPSIIGAKRMKKLCKFERFTGKPAGTHASKVVQNTHNPLGRIKQVLA